MRKASKILYLIAGIVGIIGFVGLLIGGIATLVLGITAMNPDVAAEVAAQSQGIYRGSKEDICRYCRSKGWQMH